MTPNLIGNVCECDSPDYRQDVFEEQKCFKCGGRVLND